MKGKVALICSNTGISTSSSVRHILKDSVRHILKDSNNVIIIDNEKSIPIFTDPRSILIHAPHPVEIISFEAIINEKLKSTQQWKRINQYSGKKNFKKKRR